MEKERPDEARSGGEVLAAPAVVLPSPSAQGVTGGLQGVASAVSPIAPQPLIGASGADPDALAVRIEDALAEDGRFAALVPQVGISVSGGKARLSGAVPSEGQRQSLLSAVRAVRGVEEVADDLRVS